MSKSTKKSVTVTARIPPSLAKKLDKYAKVTGHTKSWAVESLLARHVDYETWFIEQVREGIASADRGELIPTEEVFRKIREKSAKRRQAMQKKNAA
jgi:predicted transcriptional regulator